MKIVATTFYWFLFLASPAVAAAKTMAECKEAMAQAEIVYDDCVPELGDDYDVDEVLKKLQQCQQDLTNRQTEYRQCKYDVHLVCEGEREDCEKFESRLCQDNFLVRHRLCVEIGTVYPDLSWVDFDTMTEEGLAELREIVAKAHQDCIELCFEFKRGSCSIGYDECMA